MGGREARGGEAAREEGFQWGHNVHDSDHDFYAGLCIVTQYGRTALIWASKEGHLEVVETLLAAGANKFIIDAVRAAGAGSRGRVEWARGW